jgi:hypothetical protein
MYTTKIIPPSYLFKSLKAQYMPSERQRELKYEYTITLDITAQLITVSVYTAQPGRDTLEASDSPLSEHLQVQMRGLH